MGLTGADDTQAANTADAGVSDDDDDCNNESGEENQMDIDVDLFREEPHYAYNDEAMGYHSESDWSTTPSLNGSWLNVLTPPPTPPQTPPPGSNDEEQPSEDEDGFVHITEDDYWEYECWYAEDDLLELDETIAETLTEEEIASIKMASIRLFGHISQRDYEHIWYSFKQNICLMSIYRVHKKLAKLSGINPVTIDCCNNICHAFTVHYADEQACSTCQHPHFDSNKKPYKVFEYLPTMPRFQGYFNNPNMVKAMQYCHDYKREPGKIDNYINGTDYLDLVDMEIVVDGVRLGIKFLNHQWDIAYMVMLDGINLFDQAIKLMTTCWPIVAQNLNLPASERAKLRNLIPLGIIPGPNQPKDFDSFLEPFVEEALEQACGVETYNVTTGRKFTLHAHPIIITGDMQAIKHITQMKGPNGKSPCCACEIGGIYHTCHQMYYIPLTNPIDKPNAIPKDHCDPNAKPGEHTGYDPLDLPLQTPRRINRQLDKMDAAPTKTRCDELATEFGLSGDLILDHIPSIKCPNSYPHDFLHLFLLNHGPELFSGLGSTWALRDLLGHLILYLL